MNKFSYGEYDSSNTDCAFTDSTYVEPLSESDVRKELSYPLKELKDYINTVIPVDADGKTILLRLTEEELFQYSLDGETWYDTASGGHQIYDEDETQLPQRTKLMFKDTNVYNQSGYTVVEGLRGAQGVGVSSVVQVESSSVSEGQNVWRMTLTNGNTYDFVVLNGAQGEEGEKGDQGNGLVILGSYASLEDLQMAHPTGNEGDVYIVGTGDSNPAYVWDTNDNAWETIGKIRGEKGAKGDTGATGATGVGIQSVIETQHSTASGGTNIWTVTLTNGAQNTFTVLNGEAGSAGEGMPQGGSQGQLLMKRTSLDYDTEWTTLDTLPSGGTQGQVLTKQSSTDGDADWEDIDALPSGGTLGQVLTKQSSTDGDADWEDIDALPSGGTAGQVLTKVSSTDGDATWQTLSSGGTTVYDSDGTTQTAYDELIFEDVASGVDTVLVGVDMDLLWTNANTSAQFTAQTLTISGLSDYSMVAVYTRGSLYRATYFFQLFFVNKTETQLMFGSYDQGVTANTTRTLAFDATNDQITFSAASDANTMIPYQIYGIR